MGTTDFNPADLLNLIPSKYAKLAGVILVLIPLFGRLYHSLASGGGLKGVWHNFFYGTNVQQANDIQALKSAVGLPATAAPQQPPMPPPLNSPPTQLPATTGGVSGTALPPPGSLTTTLKP